MKYGYIVLLLGTLTPCWSQAVQICPSGVYSADIEVGHITPPMVLIPDVGADDGKPYDAWHFFSYYTRTHSVAAHCYYKSKGRDKVIDMPIPKNISKCVRSKAGLWCTYNRKTKHT